MKKIIIFVVIASAMLASCSNEDSPASQIRNNELGISASLAGGNATVGTRALLDGFSNDNKIGVFISGTDYTPQVGTYTCKIADGVTTWNPSTNIIYLSNNEANVYGFYPSDGVTFNSKGVLTDDNKNQLDVTILKSQAFTTGITDQTDYMYATGRTGDAEPYTYPVATASNATGKNKVDLYMHHALCKLSFIINRESSYKGTGILSSVKLSYANQFPCGTGLMSLVDGKFSSLTNESAIEFTGTATINSSGSTDAVVIGLAAPTSFSADTDLSLVLDGKTMTGKLTTGAVAAWEAGNNYKYTITIGGTGLEVNNVEVIKWTDVTAGSTNVK